MFAVIRTGNKQYKVTEGDVIEVEKLDVAEGSTVSLDEVLALVDGDKTVLGAPLLSGAKVTAEVLEQMRTPKILVFKKKRRQNYRRKNGHRQALTVLRIKNIKASA